ncbi:MAG: transposase family protein [Actinomycetes bacterium]
METRPGPRWCPGCGVRAVGHGRNRTVVRDLPIAGVPTVLVFARRRLRCPESLCEVRHVLRAATARADRRTDR